MSTLTGLSGKWVDASVKMSGFASFFLQFYEPVLRNYRLDAESRIRGM